MGVTFVWRDSAQPFDMTALSFAAFTTVTSPTSTSFQWDASDGSFWVIAGTGFTYTDDEDHHPTGGTIASIDNKTGPAPGQDGLLIPGMALSAAQFTTWVLADDGTGFLEAALSGNDIV